MTDTTITIPEHPMILTSAVAEPTPDRAHLERLRVKINDEVRDAERYARNALLCAMDVGHLLIEAKMLVEYGQWDQWLQQNITLAPRTAQAYMRLARTLPKLSDVDAQRVALLPVREAMKAIATDAKAPFVHRDRTIAYSMRADREHDKASVANTVAVIRGAAACVKRLGDLVDTNKLPAKEIDKARTALQAALASLDRLGEAVTGIEAQA